MVPPPDLGPKRCGCRGPSPKMKHADVPAERLLLHGASACANHGDIHAIRPSTEGEQLEQTGTGEMKRTYPPKVKLSELRATVTVSR